MYTASQHVALDRPALSLFGPRYSLEGVLYPSTENNVALQPILAAVLLYVQLGKNVVLGINDSFGDMYGGKTITLDATKDAMMRIYPNTTHKVT